MLGKADLILTALFYAAIFRDYRRGLEYGNDKPSKTHSVKKSGVMGKLHLMVVWF